MEHTSPQDGKQAVLTFIRQLEARQLLPPGFISSTELSGLDNSAVITYGLDLLRERRCADIRQRAGEQACLQLRLALHVWNR